MNPSSPLFPTASELRTALWCLAPWALGLPTEDDPTEAMIRGRERHKVAEDIAAGSPNAWLRDAHPWVEAIWQAVESDRAACSTYDCEPVTWLVEQGVSYQLAFPGPAAALIDREPGWRLRGAFTGTADLAYVRDDGVLVVADWKFGGGGEAYELPARENPQLWFLAVALCAALEISASSGPVVVARVELRHVHDDGEVVVDGHDITQGELDEFAGELAAMASRIRSGEGEFPKRSAACGRCKSQRACPAWRVLIEHMVESIAVRGESPLAAIPDTPEEAAILRDAIKVGRHVVGIAEARYLAWLDAHDGGLPIGLGLKEVLVTTEPRRILDTPQAIAAIRQEVGDEAIEMRPHVTLESVRRAARAHASKGAKDAAEKAALSALEERGAIVVEGFRRQLKTVRSDEQ